MSIVLFNNLLFLIQVPDAYQRNQYLTNEVKRLKGEVELFKNSAHKTKDDYTKLLKERDYHRMHHRRVVQEKNSLITDLKRLKRHYKSYEPTLLQLKSKYELAMKEKMLAKLERDRAVGQVTGLQATLRNLENGKDMILPTLSGYRKERGSQVSLQPHKFKYNFFRETAHCTKSKQRFLFYI